MFHYLRTQATSYHKNFSQKMLDHGEFTFAPGAHAKYTALPREAPNGLEHELQRAEFYAVA